MMHLPEISTWKIRKPALDFFYNRIDSTVFCALKYLSPKGSLDCLLLVLELKKISEKKLKQNPMSFRKTGGSPWKAVR